MSKISSLLDKIILKFKRKDPLDYYTISPLFDRFIIRLRRKNSDKCEIFVKEIDDAFDIVIYLKSLEYGSEGHIAQLALYDNQMRYIEGYLDALTAVNFIHSSNEKEAILKEIRNCLWRSDVH